MSEIAGSGKKILKGENEIEVSSLVYVCDDFDAISFKETKIRFYYCMFNYVLYKTRDNGFDFNLFEKSEKKIRFEKRPTLV